MKITRFILSALFGCCLVLSAVACSDLSGDNSDFNFGDMPSDEPENPYDGQGYDRLPSSVRLATYNTHRCEGWTQNSGTDRANYNNTAKVISLMDPDVIALQELDKNTTWHPTDQLQELADRTGMRPYYCKTIDYRGGDYGIGILCKTAPKNTYAGNASSSWRSSTTISLSPRTSATSPTRTDSGRSRSSPNISPRITSLTRSRSIWRATSIRRKSRKRRSNRGRLSVLRPTPL